MAPPKGVKRVAATAAGGAGKKAKTSADPVAPKCKEVVAAINSASALPDSCKEMLSDMVRSSLTVFASERHAYQNQAVEMLRETLAAVQSEMQTVVSEAQGKVDSSDREKASRAAALEQAQASLASTEENASSGKEAVDSDKAAVAAAKANSAAAQASIEAAEAAVASMTEQKSKLEAAMKDMWEPLKTAKAHGVEGNRNIKALCAVFIDVGLEAGLIDSLPETLKKTPEERGTFDGIVAQHVEKQTAAYLATADTSVKDATANLANNGKATAEAALAAAQEKLAASSAALHSAEASLKEKKHALKAAQAGVDSFEKEMSHAGGSIEKAKSALEEFKEGALQSFAALKDLAPPPEPEPEAAAEAPAEPEAPAE